MKVLVTGNSQAGALKRAHAARANLLQEAGLEMCYYVIPGGMGPDLEVRANRIALRHVSPKAPPYMSPPGTDAMALSSFDAIVISALGFFDGGFAYRNPISRCGMLSRFEPRGVGAQQAPVSDSCFHAMMRAQLDRQPGVRSLRALCAAFDGPVLVQRFPRISEEILEHSDWDMRQYYTKPLAAHLFMEQSRDTALAQILHDTGATLLEYPDFGPECDTPQSLTPRAYMREDCVHQSDAYGALMLDQISRHLIPAAVTARG